MNEENVIISEKKYVTNENKINDGFGENYKILIYTLFYCEFNNCEFVYSPFTQMEHNYDNDINYLKKKESLINFIDNFVINQPNNKAIIIPTFTLLSFYEKNISLFLQSECLKTIKRIFRNNKTKINRSVITPQSITTNIAIHIRRMNQQDRNRFSENDRHSNKVLPGMDVPNDVYLDILTQLNRIYPNNYYHIYSQGNVSDFTIFTKNNNIILHLNEDLEKTFTDMVYADILIMSPSALSYTAALLSDNVIYYIQFCNPHLPHWNVIQNYKSSRMKHEFLMNVMQPVLTSVYYVPLTENIYMSSNDKLLN
jgi:hypothetical protein